ncbi:MAG: class I SAM-dependent methyltransferase, partial [Verrucomicrobiota bacterium]|nr:class I SAM-dependent methyltransferase [Verrucomicrobiota bacterium]
MYPAVAPTDLPSRHFKPRVYGVGAWTDNLHFAYDLVATLRPRLLVELGTDRGESYFAFCQAAAENATGTRCFAVDTWQGDEQAGGYDETTFREVSQHNATHYAAFSQLLRSTFDDAVDQFTSQSIDVLHLDGLHTEDAVRHDLDRWLPKIRPGGILLMHDVAVRVRDFGVWKVWEELRTRGRSYTFSDGPGLGVWQKPPTADLPFPTETLLRADEPSLGPLATYYRERAGEMQELITRHWRNRTIGQTAAGSQSIVQVFYTRDGTHHEEHSALARIGHEHWKEIVIRLPKGAGAAPLRIDFGSPFTIVDLKLIELTGDGISVWTADDASAFNAIAIAGDAERLPHSQWLRVAVTGLDPQLHLPVIETATETDLRL